MIMTIQYDDGNSSTHSHTNIRMHKRVFVCFRELRLRPIRIVYARIRTYVCVCVSTRREKRRRCGEGRGAHLLISIYKLKGVVFLSLSLPYAVRQCVASLPEAHWGGGEVGAINEWNPQKQCFRFFQRKSAMHLQTFEFAVGKKNVTICRRETQKS